VVLFEVSFLLFWLELIMISCVECSLVFLVVCCKVVWFLLVGMNFMMIVIDFFCFIGLFLCWVVMIVLDGGVIGGVVGVVF